MKSNTSNHLYLDSYPNPNNTYNILGDNAYKITLNTVYDVTKHPNQ
jgi:hypothetical protein